ncbi:LLM class flavin-dependent oxidoreductase [Bacillus halotolerans]|uniref:LLM class flavin-dependent oxidoreductase n=1 Tax=Bacillus subtilis group TaxID=653685 RepID=UPI00397B4C81
MSTSPDMLSVHAALHTKNIRIGSGGIMLPNHSPFKVVENFTLLEALHPGRIDPCNRKNVRNRRWRKSQK